MKKVCFIIFNIILTHLMIIFIIFVPHGFVYDLGLFLPILTIVDCVTYQNHIQKYPLNDFKEYQFNILQDNFANFDEKEEFYYINIYHSDGMYKTISGEKQMIFNMKGCIFPKNYLRAYFVRNIHFLIIKKKIIYTSIIKKSKNHGKL